MPLKENRRTVYFYHPTGVVRPAEQELGPTLQPPANRRSPPWFPVRTQPPGGGNGLGTPPVPHGRPGYRC